MYLTLSPASKGSSRRFVVPGRSLTNMVSMCNASDCEGLKIGSALQGDTGWKRAVIGRADYHLR